MRSAHLNLILLLLTVQLAACATPQPIQYKDVIEPQAVAIEPLQSDQPIVALALGSGGSRGFAHLGVIKALEANDIHIDIVVGTSAGSVVGALYAAGYKSEAIEQIALDLDQDRLRDTDLSTRGYIRGEQLQDYINRELKNRSIEQLDKPFVAVATQFDTGNAVAFNRGNTGMAVRASSSIPGVYYPVQIGEHEYVDGDLKSPVPVTVARTMGADIVIAVDISQQPQDQPFPQDIIDILKQSLRIMRQSVLAYQIETAQIVIRPEIGKTPEINADGKLRLIKNGEDAAIAMLPQIREWIKKSPQKSCP
ncbi:MAG: patatin-like phospholipase family protein [Gallionella sp.]